MNSLGQIVRLDCKNKEHSEIAASLHFKLLPNSTYAQLGDTFMREFVYDKLIKERLIQCDFFWCEGEYVGLIVYSEHSSTFIMNQAKKHYFIFLIYLILKCLIQNPFRLRTVFKMIKESTKRSSVENIENVEKIGQFLSFGVLRSHSTLKDMTTGMRISQLLFENMNNYFRKKNIKKFALLVNKQNKSALRFYYAHGGYIRADFDQNTYELGFNLS